MKKSIIFCLTLLVSLTVFGQTSKPLDLNTAYKDLALSKTESHVFKMALTKGGIYQFSILQQGVAAHITLNDADKSKFLKATFPKTLTATRSLNTRQRQRARFI